MIARDTDSISHKGPAWAAWSDLGFVHIFFQAVFVDETVPSPSKELLIAVTQGNLEAVKALLPMQALNKSSKERNHGVYLCLKFLLGKIQNKAQSGMAAGSWKVGNRLLFHGPYWSSRSRVFCLWRPLRS